MNIIVPYTPIYIDKCFYEWYKAGRPKFQSLAGGQVLRVLPVDEDGRKPNMSTIRMWMNKYDWESRADALDAQLSLKLDTEAIEAKAKLYDEIAGIGKDVMLRGKAFLDKDGFDTSAAALRAIFGGAELVAKFGTAADMLLSVAQMNDKQVEREIYRLLGKGENENDITAPAEDIIDADSTEDTEDAETDNEQ